MQSFIILNEKLKVALSLMKKNNTQKNIYHKSLLSIFFLLFVFSCERSYFLCFLEIIFRQHYY